MLLCRASMYHRLLCPLSSWVLPFQRLTGILKEFCVTMLACLCRIFYQLAACCSIISCSSSLEVRTFTHHLFQTYSPYFLLLVEFLVMAGPS